MVTIITPTYNAAPYISQTFKGVLSQTFTDWEWILVDDHSSDDTVSVIHSLIDRADASDRIRLISLEENGGAANARNIGLDNARGRYIAFLDSDDIWLPKRLETGMNLITQPDVGFVFTAYEFGDENAKGTGRIVHVPEKLEYKKALSRTVIFTSTTLFDKERIPEKLLHMPRIPSEDTATWWQILRAGHTAYGVDTVTVIYRRPASSLSSNKLVAIKRIWNLYRKAEHLSPVASAFYFVGWAIRATLRRV